jgi:kinesin family protein 23
VWLDHKPVGTVDTGTILQPNIKRKKSVSKLEEKDTKEASKYVLTHQEMDSDDKLTTKLVKV